MFSGLKSLPPVYLALFFVFGLIMAMVNMGINSTYVQLRERIMCTPAERRDSRCEKKALIKAIDDYVEARVRASLRERHTCPCELCEYTPTKCYEKF